MAAPCTSGGGVIAPLRRFVQRRLGNYRLAVLTRLVQWPVRVPLRAILPRRRRDPRLIAFGSWSGGFFDNSAYLFIHMAQHADRRCVSVADSDATVRRLRAAGLEAVRRWSFAGMRTAIDASWYVYSYSLADINTALADGAITFNLWHGVGVKRIQRGMQEHWKTKLYAARGRVAASLFADDRRVPDWLLSTSPMMTERFSEAFDVPLERCVELGYPRNDHLVRNCRPPDLLVDPELYARIDAARPVVGYFPTFRDASLDLPGGAPLLHEMSEILGSQGAALLFKAHHESFVEEVPSSPSLIQLPVDADLNAYLGLCDVLITDVSSVGTDYLLLDRPIVLFCPDLDDFTSGRGLYFDPQEMMGGTLTRTKDELYDVLRDIRGVKVDERGERLARMYFGDDLGAGASARITEFIVAHTGVAT